MLSSQWKGTVCRIYKTGYSPTKAFCKTKQFCSQKLKYLKDCYLTFDTFLKNYTLFPTLTFPIQLVKTLFMARMPDVFHDVTEFVINYSLNKKVALNIVPLWKHFTIIASLHLGICLLSLPPSAMTAGTVPVYNRKGTQMSDLFCRWADILFLHLQNIDIYFTVFF